MRLPRTPRCAILRHSGRQGSRATSGPGGWSWTLPRMRWRPSTARGPERSSSDWRAAPTRRPLLAGPSRPGRSWTAGPEASRGDAVHPWPTRAAPTKEPGGTSHRPMAGSPVAPCIDDVVRALATAHRAPRALEPCVWRVAALAGPGRRGSAGAACMTGHPRRQRGASVGAQGLGGASRGPLASDRSRSMHARRADGRGRAEEPGPHGPQWFPETLTSSSAVTDTGPRSEQAGAVDAAPRTGGGTMGIGSRRALSAVAVAALVAACGGGGASPSAAPSVAPSVAPSSAAPAPSESAAAGGWPYTGTLKDGSDVHAQARASRTSSRTTSRSTTCSRMARRASRCSRRSTWTATTGACPEAQKILPTLNGTAVAPAGALQDANEQIAQIQAQLDAGQIDCLSVQSTGLEYVHQDHQRHHADGHPGVHRGRPVERQRAHELHPDLRARKATRPRTSC